MMSGSEVNVCSSSACAPILARACTRVWAAQVEGGAGSSLGMGSETGYDIRVVRAKDEPWTLVILPPEASGEGSRSVGVGSCACLVEVPEHEL